ncbi:adenylate cyclase [Burkholderia mayonis]|uniref:Adenylate cyclase n=2 Tax=Burkholderiaceae TaxID=119060 RepID=A0A1B4FM86_9BURK|nr:adenylate cyclase [Burkholderia mayonis]KVE36802.1 adenylate cyclase [Burkholderia sp. BDU5]KVE41310.1 adenylate cyclase [Burkholderia mayonis]
MADRGNRFVTFDRRSSAMIDKLSMHPGVTGTMHQELHGAMDSTQPSATGRAAESTLAALVERVRGETGVVPAHLIELQRVAREHDCLIGIRPVDRFATDLIESGHPTKGFHIKGKSANWGPQAAFICVDQRFSKLEDKPDRIEKFDRQVQSCIAEGYAKRVPLTLSKARFDKLLDEGLIDRIKRDGNGMPATFEAKAPSGAIYSFEATHVHSAGEDRYAIAHRGEPIEVLAPPKDGAKPLTADYDLLLIGPRFDDLGPQDNLPVPDVSHEVFKARLEGYKNGIPDALRSPYQQPSEFYRKEDTEIGNASSRVREMIPIINAALVGDGEAVVHHSTDSGSPAADPDANYPATFALPQKIGCFDEICIVHDKHELAELIGGAKQAGYHVPLNPLWEKEVTSVRRESFRVAREQLSANLR